jgi:hypothetical protein
MNLTVNIEKKPSNYIPDTNSVILAGSNDVGASFNKSNSTVMAINLPPFQDNETTVFRRCSISNMNDKYNYTVGYELGAIPEGLNVVITYTTDPYTQVGRIVWTEGATLFLPRAQTYDIFITVTDVGLEEGIHSFSIKFYTV